MDIIIKHNVNAILFACQMNELDIHLNAVNERLRLYESNR